MKRYFVFAGDNYYPCGGMGDFKASFDDLERAQAFAEELRKRFDWVEVEDVGSRL